MKVLGKALICASVCLFAAAASGLDSACIERADSVTGLVIRLSSDRTLLVRRHALCEQDLTVDDRWYLQRITNEGDSPQLPTELRATSVSSKTSEVVWIGANRSYLTRTATHYAFLSFHCAYDALEWNGEVWFCYNCAGMLCVERMPVLGALGPRERLLLLASDSASEPVDVWTNAVFSSLSNGIPEFAAYADVASVVGWRWEDGALGNRSTSVAS